MIKKSKLKAILAEINKKAKIKKAEMVEIARNVDFIEKASGVQICDNSYDFDWNRNCFTIKEADLTAVRKVVGQFQDVVGKTLAYDFESTNELVIAVQPKTGPFSKMIFEYRRQLLDTDDCKVEDVHHEGSSGYTCKQLVCTVN